MSLRQWGGIRNGFVYGITLVPLLGTMGYYFLEHVPSREEYFLNLRFRTMGVIGRQIGTKLEAVSSGLTYGLSVGRIDQAEGGGKARRVKFEDYVKQVFPDLQSPEGPSGAANKKAGDAKSRIDPNIEFVQDRVRFTISPGERQWEDSLAELIRPLTEDDSFDDVLLADQKGAVLFQRSDAPPKLRNVSALLKPEAESSGSLQLFRKPHSEGDGSNTDLLRRVDLDGSAYRLLAQPLTIRVPRSPTGVVKELILCGLVRSETIRQEAMHVPPTYLWWIIVPLFAGVLSGPLLKLILIRRTGRLETRDLPLLALFSSLAMAMLAVVLLTWHLSQQNAARLESASKRLADGVAEQVLECFRRGRQVLKEVDAFAARRDGPAAARPTALNRTGIWSWTELTRGAPAVKTSNLEFVFWTSADGFQIEKWTPLETNTPFYPQRTSSHFGDAVAGQYWRARSDAGSPFTAELRISPTTSTPIAVLTMPSNRHAKLNLSPDRRAIDPMAPEALKPAFVSIVETPRNLLSPVIPPGAGFALILRDGSVLYHSDHDRILSENLFRETEHSTALSDAVATQSEGGVDGLYRGSNVAFYVRPIREVSGVPWTIVVFREIEAWQTLVWQVGFDVFLLYLALWLLPVLGVPGVMLYVKWRRQCSWNACRVAALQYFWPKENAADCYRAVTVIECVLIAALLGVLAWFGKRPDGAAGTVVLLSGLLLPAASLVVWTWQLRRWESRAAASPQSPRNGAVADASGWRVMYVAAAGLTLFASSVFPVAGFFFLAFRMESGLDVRHWQNDLAVRVLKHRADAEAEVRQPEKFSPEGVAVALKLALPPADTGLCDSERLYESWEETVIRCGPMSVPRAETPAWERVLQGLRMRAFGLEPAAVALGTSGGVTRTGISEPILAISRAGAPDIVVKSKLWNLTLLPRSAAWWALAAMLLAAGFVWVWTAASRLFLFDFHQIPMRTLDQLRETGFSNPILVLGLPRSGKDGAVRRFIDAIEAERDKDGQCGAAVRASVDLKRKIDNTWLAQVLTELGLETFFAMPPVLVHDVAASASAPAATALAASASVSLPYDTSSTTPFGARQRLQSGGPMDESATSFLRIPDYVHVTNLEAAIQDRESRDVTMRLLDALVRAHSAGRLKLVVTSVVDPMFHFDIIFPDQNDEIDRSQLPETEFGRWAHVFLQFERVLVDEPKPEIDEAEKACKTGCLGTALWEECRHHRALRRFGQMIAVGIEERIRAGARPPTSEQIIDELYEKAFALYKLLWSGCTRPEKLLLVQVAQTGLVNPICRDTMHDLLRKGLIVLKPYPAVMNASFSRFLQSAATGEQIRFWEKEAGESQWLTVRNVLIILVVFVLIMIGVSQDHALQSISGILTAVVGGIGGVFKLVETIGSKWGNKAAGAPAGAE